MRQLITLALLFCAVLAYSQSDRVRTSSTVLYRYDYYADQASGKAGTGTNFIQITGGNELIVNNGQNTFTLIELIETVQTPYGPGRVYKAERFGDAEYYRIEVAPNYFTITKWVDAVEDGVYTIFSNTVIRLR